MSDSEMGANQTEGDDCGGFPPVARNQCPHCFTQFTLEKNYVDHMWSVHGSRRPFRCDDCGIFLSYRSSLYNHRKIHSDKRPFACTDCNAMFRWNNSLKYHMTRAHQKYPPFEFSTKARRRRDASSAVQRVAPNAAAEIKRETPPDRSSPVPISLRESTSTEANDQTTRIVQLLIASVAEARHSAAEAAKGQSDTSPAITQRPANSVKSSRKPSRPRQILSKAAPQPLGAARLEPRKCDGCGRKFYLPEALEAHRETCGGATGSRQSFNKKSPVARQQQPIDQGRSELSVPTILSVDSTPSLDFGSPDLIGGGGSVVYENGILRGGGGMGRNENVVVVEVNHEGRRLSNSSASPMVNGCVDQTHSLPNAGGWGAQLGQICAQQEAILRRLEGFEHWVQARVTSMETILTALLSTGVPPVCKPEPMTD